MARNLRHGGCRIPLTSGTDRNHFAVADELLNRSTPAPAYKQNTFLTQQWGPDLVDPQRPKGTAMEHTKYAAHTPSFSLVDALPSHSGAPLSLTDAAPIYGLPVPATPQSCYAMVKYPSAALDLPELSAATAPAAAPLAAPELTEAPAPVAPAAPVAPTPAVATVASVAPAPAQHDTAAPGQGTFPAHLTPLIATLPEEDQKLLRQRMIQQIQWKEIAFWSLPIPARFDDASVHRESARLRKRYQRLMTRLRRQLKPSL